MPSEKQIKYRESMKGRKPSEKQIKLWESMKGRKLSEKTRAKMRLSSFRKGKPAPNKGKKVTAEVLEKIRKASTGRFYSEETRRKISESNRGKKCPWARPPVLRGEKSPSWKGGITPLYNKIRNSIETKKWRKSVFERDGYACIIGGVSHGNKLNADHIKSFSTIIIENKIKTFEEALGCFELWDVSNGRTLCVECHRKTDNFAGRGRIYNKSSTTKKVL